MQTQYGLNIDGISWAALANSRVSGLIPLESAFVIFDWPDGNIQRALLGPMSPSMCDGDLYQLVCLAVATNGERIAVKRIYKRLENIASIWPYMASLLDRGYTTIPRDENSELLSEQDMFSVCCSPNFWISTETDGDPLHPAVRQLAKKLSVQELGVPYPVDVEQGIFYEMRAKELLAKEFNARLADFLSAVSPEVRDTLTNRPDLNIRVKTAILRAAQCYGPCARRNAIQALRTEPLGLLELMAAQNNVDGKRLLDTLLSGSSLPEQLRLLGVSARTHRRFLKFDKLPLSGSAWLAIAQKFDAYRIDGDTQTNAFFRAIKSLSLMGVNNPCTVADALDWITCRGGEKIAKRSLRLATQVKELIEASLEYGNDSATPDEVASWLFLPQKLSTKESDHATSPLFSSYFDVPKDLPLPQGWEIRALNSLRSILSHGESQGNCLSNVRCVIRYLQEGVILLGLYVNGEAKATMAVQPVCVQNEIVYYEVESDCSDHSIFLHAHLATCISEIESICALRQQRGSDVDTFAREIIDVCKSMRQVKISDFDDFISLLLEGLKGVGE
jgi:hypothetical protein